MHFTSISQRSIQEKKKIIKQKIQLKKHNKKVPNKNLFPIFLQVVWLNLHSNFSVNNFCSYLLHLYFNQVLCFLDSKNKKFFFFWLIKEKEVYNQILLNKFYWHTIQERRIPINCVVYLTNTIIRKEKYVIITNTTLYWKKAVIFVFFVWFSLIYKFRQEWENQTWYGKDRRFQTCRGRS